MLYAVTDIETTGGYAAANAITEIAIYFYDGKRVVKHFETLINPRQHIPNYITALTGISNAMVADAPYFEDIAADLAKLYKDAVFVAHNVNFDYSFVNHQMKQAGYEMPVKKLCTVRLSKKIFPGYPSYSLGNICRNLQIPISNRHRAGGDAQATVQLLEHCLQHGAATVIDDMLRKTSGEQWLPLHLSKKDILQLPSGPGVYYFHDEKDKVVYVGKAVNIRKRVSSHFTHNDADRKRQQFLRHIHKITCKECATELQALVLESAEIKRLWPKYNSSQKQPQQRYALYQFEDHKGYIHLAIDRKKKHLPALYTFNLLHEGTVMLQRMIAEFALDARLCFIPRQPIVTADNDNKEMADIHNQKVKAALAALQTQLPTFALIDDGLRPDEKLCLLVEQGVFWGMGYVPATLQLADSYTLKNYLQPYPDNDNIRNAVYNFAQRNPAKRVNLKTNEPSIH
jgi:DNA polymerase III subunit epsilon